MALIRFTERPDFRNPWAEFERIRQGMDKFSQNLISEGKSHMNPTVFPPLNIYEEGDVLLLKAELPGIQAEDLDISIEGDTLTLQGTRKHAQEDENVSYHRREIETGNFSRAIALPAKIDIDKITAKLIDGILILTLHKADIVKPKQIKITTEDDAGASQ